MTNLFFKALDDSAKATEELINNPTKANADRVVELTDIAIKQSNEIIRKQKVSNPTSLS